MAGMHKKNAGPDVSSFPWDAEYDEDYAEESLDPDYDSGYLRRNVQPIARSLRAARDVEQTSSRPSVFIERFGTILAADGIAAIPRGLYLQQKQLGLSLQQVWLVSSILAHKWSARLPYVSLGELARRISDEGQSSGRDRYVRKIKQQLCDAGYLVIHRRENSIHGQLANAYDFSPLLRKIGSLIADAQDAAEKYPGDDIDIDDADNVDEDFAANQNAQVADSAGPTDYSFVARFGADVVRGGVLTVPMGLFTFQRELALSMRQLWFVCYVLSHQYSAALPYPSLRKMAAVTGYSAEYIHTVKHELVEAGYLRLISRVGRAGQESNLYDFRGLFSALEDMVSKIPAAKESAEEGYAGTTGILDAMDTNYIDEEDPGF